MKILICFLAFAASLVAQTYSDARIEWPSYRGGMSTSGAAMNSTNTSLGFRWSAKKACSVTKVHLYLATVTTAQSITVSLQNLNTSFYPDGTVDQSGAIATPAVGWNVATLDTGRTVAASDTGAAVASWTGTQGSVETGGFSLYTWLWPPELALPAVYTSAWANGSTPAPAVGLECSDGSFLPTNEGAGPYYQTYTDIASNSTPDEVGNRFQIPFGAKACGATYFGRREAPGATADLVLYNSSGTSLASCSTAQATGDATARSCYFSSQITLSADTTYYIALKPTTTNAVRITRMVLPDADALGALPGNVQTYLATRTDAGSFSTTTTERASIAVELCAVAASSGSSGGASAHTWIQ